MLSCFRKDEVSLLGAMMLESRAFQAPLFLTQRIRKPETIAPIGTCFDVDEVFFLLDMLPSEALMVNRQEARDLAIASIHQAVEDFRAEPIALEIPGHLHKRSDRSAWLRVARSRSRRAELHRADAERFFRSAWFEDMCEVIGLSPDEIRRGIYDRKNRQ